MKPCRRCIQSEIPSAFEKQSISIRPYFPVTGDVKILKGLKGVLFSKDPSNFVYSNYVFSRSSRSIIDEIVLGPVEQDLNEGLVFKLPL